MIEDLVICMVYMSFIFGLFAVAGFLEWLVERVPFLNRMMDRWLEYMGVCLYDEEDYDDD